MLFRCANGFSTPKPPTHVIAGGRACLYSKQAGLCVGVKLSVITNLPKTKSNPWCCYTLYTEGHPKRTLKQKGGDPRHKASQNMGPTQHHNKNPF